MKRIMKNILGVMLSAVLLLAFAGCGGESSKQAAPPTPEEEAVAALDASLAALKSADINAIEELSGEEMLEDAEGALGSEEETKDVMTALFGHFDYQLGTPEKVDDTHVNVPATVSNADMQKATNTWVSSLMEYAMSNPEIASDEDALHAKTVEELKSAVEKTVEGEDGIVTKDVVFPMVLEDGKWTVSDDVDDEVIDAITGGFMSAINQLSDSMTE